MFVHFTVKMAFLVFYLRLSPKKNFKSTVYATMAMCTVFLTVEWLLAFLQARPLAAMFNQQAYPDAKYLSQYVVQMIPTALVCDPLFYNPPTCVFRPNRRPPMKNAFSDIVILVLPIPTVLKLQMSTRRKIAVLAVICFGSLSVITALCRFIVQKQLISEPDTPYVMGHMIIVAGIEIQIAVIAVNLPALRSLFTRIVGSSHDRSTNYHHGYGAHKLSSLNRSRRQHENLGATLSSSEEELMRKQGGYGTSNIKVVTDVDIASQRAADDNISVDFGFPLGPNKNHVRAA